MYKVFYYQVILSEGYGFPSPSDQSTKIMFIGE